MRGVKGLAAHLEGDAVGAAWGSSKYGSPNIKGWLQPRNVVLAETAVQDRLGSRTCVLWCEAEAFWEETGKSTRREPRGRGLGTYTRIAEIMSGRTISQQGLAATCKDPPYKG